MSSKVSISVILSWQLSAILAQQACYWPNGSLPPSDQTVLVNCYSSEESICCGQGDMCMSNGLCIGGQGGTAYRGGCTDKTWSNVTACPQWCNDLYPSNYANIYFCPGPRGAYCDQSLSSPCQSGTELEVYASAKILGTPPLSSTTNVATPNSSIATTFTSVTEPTASITLANPPTCTPIIHQSSLPATAIGVGLGVPFGIAAIGFSVFLFWRDARRKHPRGPKQDTSQDRRITRYNTVKGGEMDGNGLQPELPNTMMTAELHGNEMVQ